MRMSNFKIFFYAAIYFVLCSSISDGQILQCGKGSLELSSKDKNTGFININCGDFPLSASFPSSNSGRCFSGITIVPRTGWNAKPDRIQPRILTKSSECILADGNSYTISDSNYVGRMQTDQNFQNDVFGSMVDNFHIGNNGRIYEALGWDAQNGVKGGGLDCLRVSFVKATRDEPPSAAAVTAYKQLVKTAICLGKLTAYYKLIPSYLIEDGYFLEDSSFERNGMRKWKNYNANPDLRDDSILGKHAMVFREEWTSEKPLEKWLKYSDPIKNVVLGNYYYRCFYNCSGEVKYREGRLRPSGEDIHINFYLADDGLAYESYGWDNTWSDYWINKNAVSIDFLGKFNTYLPSERAMIALNHLLRLGIIWGKLSPDYKIISYRKVTDKPDYIGNALQEAIRKMPRFTEEF